MFVSFRFCRLDFLHLTMLCMAPSISYLPPLPSALRLSYSMFVWRQQKLLRPTSRRRRRRQLRCAHNQQLGILFAVPLCAFRLNCIKKRPETRRTPPHSAPPHSAPAPVPGPDSGPLEGPGRRKQNLLLSRKRHRRCLTRCWFLVCRVPLPLALCLIFNVQLQRCLYVSVCVGVCVCLHSCTG